MKPDVRINNVKSPRANEVRTNDFQMKNVPSPRCWKTSVLHVFVLFNIITVVFLFHNLMGSTVFSLKMRTKKKKSMPKPFFKEAMKFFKVFFFHFKNMVQGVFYLTNFDSSLIQGKIKYMFIWTFINNILWEDFFTKRIRWLFQKMFKVSALILQTKVARFSWTYYLWNF